MVGELQAAGHEVWGLSRNAESLQMAGLPLSRQICAELHREDWHREASGDWDVVVNLVSSAGNGLEGYKLSYIDGNASLLKWAAQRHVGRFIYTSATSVYSQSDGQLVTEDDVPSDEALSSSGVLLRQAERLVLSAYLPDCERLVLRLAGIYGPGRHLYLDTIQRGESALPGDGSAWLNLIYLKDIVSFLVHCVQLPQLPEHGVFNLVDDEPSRKQSIADWLSLQLGCGPVLFDSNLSGPRAARRTAGGKLPDRRVCNARLKAAFGWVPGYPSFREGYLDILGK